MTTPTDRDNPPSNDREQGDRERGGGWREAIWSVPRAFVFAYFGLLTLLGLPAVALITWQEAANGVDAVWWLWPTTLTVAAAPRCGAVGIGIAFSALVTVQGAAFLMVLYEYAVNKWVKPIINRNVEAGRAAGVEEGIEKGMEKGVEKTDQEWLAWLARKADAESRGLPFDEPMPNEKRD